MQSICVFVALAIVISTVSPVAANAAGSSPVVISELLTGTPANASQEFVELYNASSQPVSVDGWTIEYKSATSTDVASSWSRKATLSGSVAGFGYYLVASSQLYPESDSEWSSTLSSTGGHVRVKDGAGKVSDLVGYGTTANAAEGTPMPAPASGKSIERMPGALNPLAGNGVDTGNNVLDFMVRDEPQPQSTQSAIETFDPIIPVPEADPIETPAVPTLPTAYPALEITELLVNPASPLSDDQDEFIELYNPNSFPVNVQGYQLRTGSNFTSSYVIPPLQIGPYEYAAFKSEQTGLSLTNSGGAVRLLDPSGAMTDQTETYGQAPDGQSWAKFVDGWRWTLETTFGKPNIAVGLVATVKPKKIAAKKTTAKKPAEVKVAKAKSSKAPKNTKKKTGSSSPVQVAGARLQPATWLIILLAILTIGYATYEFRNDIRNLFYRLKSRFAAGRPDR
ncbi:lamin tail domain-containing protein [Patescibacteria group bacterium]|nr:MAG: lamin tail domain-containing protein [Patescibacteria group bacterium]